MPQKSADESVTFNNLDTGEYTNALLMQPPQKKLATNIDTSRSQSRSVCPRSRHNVSYACKAALATLFSFSSASSGIPASLRTLLVHARKVTPGELCSLATAVTMLTRPHGSDACSFTAFIIV